MNSVLRNLSFTNRHKLWLAATALLVLLAGGLFADYWSALPEGIEPQFVGRSTCIECHQQEAKLFTGSHHDLAMDVATPVSVIGDFNNATLEHDGITSRMFRDGDRFMISTEGETGEIEDFEIKYVFGVDPLQQYMVEFDRPEDASDDEIGRLQVLRVSWDTRKKEWFYLRPPDVDDKLSPEDPLHWTGIAQRWQTMCAECHSTNLESNYHVASGKYHTTFSEIDVSCEACHGPGSLHVELARSKSIFWDRRYKYGLARLKGKDAEPQLQACAPCHSRRGVMNDQFHPGDKFTDHFNLELLHDSIYYHDGQIKDEVYVYGSFVQSRMYHKGIRCTDCHDPHSLKLKADGNKTCTSCHQHAAGKYDVPSHHHHQPGTPGAMCVNCHMPHTTYMEVDPRRDHSLRIPRPDLSLKIGTPNACSGCHVKDQLESLPKNTASQLNEYADWLTLAESDETVKAALMKANQYCDTACEQWYGADRRKDKHFAETFALFRDRPVGVPPTEDAIKAMTELALQPNDKVPAIARATALRELAMTGSSQIHIQARKILDNKSEHPMVRAAAAGVFSWVNTQDPERRLKTIQNALVPHLEDESRLVRIQVTRALLDAGIYADLRFADRKKVDKALEEVREELSNTSDRASAHMNWAMMCQTRGKMNEAIASYRAAIKTEPKMTGPRSNLSEVFETLAASDPKRAADYQQEAKKLRAEELPLLARDASLAPDIAQLQYRYGMALYLNGEPQKALQQVEKAIALEPSVQLYQVAKRSLEQHIESLENDQ